MPALALLHICLVQTSSARGRVLFAVGFGWQSGLEHWLANIAGLLRALVLEGGLNYPRWDVICLIVAGHGNFSA